MFSFNTDTLELTLSPFTLFVIGGAFSIHWLWSTIGQSPRQKVMLATWGAPREGCIFTKAALDCTEMLAYIKEKNEGLEPNDVNRVTVTHFVGRALAECLKDAPDLNRRILWNRFLPNKTLDISFLVQVLGGRNLYQAKVEAIDKKSIREVASILNSKVKPIRSGSDKNMSKSMGPMKFLPVWVIRTVMYFVGWASNVVGIDMSMFGMEKRPFGCCIVTSVGMLGIEDAYVPFSPYTNVSLFVMIGAIKDHVVVVDGKPAVRPMVNICATLDHRFLDGFQGASIGKKLERVFANPSLIDKKAD
ncbi:CoA-dependent acyltransferase [Basidiobolus meristosporus CBS 931.73]|uniref:CoA-dependent acyltransferase n=1 Tax=Basidiobolus meristosporus CBS 931.73 TaxID=1314790 RepID=A0A1Y1Z846_9FUNG|nr:CoA-dependent acyltransferase [Basidiobolus meristosporus CBS 931.73]|eukprot:ORY06440.1 CoA-dependent acyltransferase [Basidiobolus meristosporus CBS 931.73]